MTTRCVAVAVAAVVLAGCGGASPGPGPDPTTTAAPLSNSQRIQRLLDRRAAALGRGRTRSFAATSVRVEQGAERAAATTARGLGLRGVRYEIGQVKVRGDRASVDARLAYNVRGVRGDFGEARTLQARRTARGWRVVRSGVGDRLADPWTLGAYERVDTPHFVVWAPPGVTVPTAALEAGYARVGDLLDQGRLRPRYLVVIARDPADARRLTGSIGGLDGVTAITASLVRLAGPERRVAKVSSLRLLVIASTFSAQDAEGQRQVVIHELTHVLLTPLTSGRTPSWLREGVAEYVSGDYRLTEAQYYRAAGVAPTLASLSAPDAIGQLRGEPQSAAYAVSAAVAWTIAQRFGRDKLIDLYLAFNDPSLRGRAGDPRLTDRAVRRVLGVGLEDLGA